MILVFQKNVKGVLICLGRLKIFRERTSFDDEVKQACSPIEDYENCQTDAGCLL